MSCIAYYVPSSASDAASALQTYNDACSTSLTVCVPRDRALELAHSSALYFICPDQWF